MDTPKLTRSFEALWEFYGASSRRLAADWKEERQVNPEIYGCFCAMWAYYLFSTYAHDDDQRVMPHNLSDFFDARDFLKSRCPEVMPIVEDLCDQISKIPEAFRDRVDFEDFRTLWSEGVVGDDFSNALNRFYDYAKADLGGDRLIQQALDGYAQRLFQYLKASHPDFAATFLRK